LAVASAATLRARLHARTSFLSVENGPMRLPS
jgi:hypothetical protein